MLAPLRHDVALSTPPIEAERPGDPPLILSQRPPHAIPHSEQLIELRDEDARRRSLYPRWIAEKRIRQDEADRHLAVLAAIVDDLAEPVAPITPAEHLRRYADRVTAQAAAGIGWEDKIRELRRELALRRNVVPKRLAAGRITPAEARRRIETIEALHCRYWIRLEAWEPDPAWDQATARAAFRELWLQRDAWDRGERVHGDADACPPEQFEVTLNDKRIRVGRDGPWCAIAGRLINAAGDATLYSPDFSIAARLHQLGDEAHEALAAIVTPLNTAWRCEQRLELEQAA